MLIIIFIVVAVVIITVVSWFESACWYELELLQPRIVLNIYKANNSYDECINMI